MLIYTRLAAGDCIPVSRDSEKPDPPASLRKTEVKNPISYLKLLLIVAIGATVAPLTLRAEEATCRYVKLVSLPITYTNYQPTVEGTINDTKVTMLIDTGNYDTQMTQQTAEKLGLKLQSSRQMSEGASGESSSYKVIIKEFSLGPIKAGKLPIYALSNIKAEVGFGAIVGSNVLLQRDIEIMLRDKQLNFFHPVGCDKDSFLAYWDENASFVDLTSLSASSMQPIVTVEINGKPMKAMIDTGAQTSSISTDAAARVGVRTDSAGVTPSQGILGIGRHKIPSWIASFDSFSIGEETVKNVQIEMWDYWAGKKADHRFISNDERLEQYDMLLGADFIEAHRMLFATSQRRLYFSYLGGNVFYEHPPIKKADTP